MNTSKKDKWEEDLRSRIKKLRERAEKAPEPKKPDFEPKNNVTEENQYLEIKDEWKEAEKKPDVSVKIEKENHYAVIKPIIDEIKEKAKEEIYEEKVKEEKKSYIKKEEAEIPKQKLEISKVGIETTIDRLIAIIDKRGNVTTIDLSKELGVSVERIESWAKMLEDRGLIEIEYPLIGSSRLRKKEWKKES